MAIYRNKNLETSRNHQKTNIQLIWTIDIILSKALFLDIQHLWETKTKESSFM